MSETAGAREAINRMTKRLLSDGTIKKRDEARELARQAALRADRENRNRNK